MNNFKLWLACALASFIPWGLVLQPFGTQVQLTGVVVQIIGLAIMVVKRKAIW